MARAIVSLTINGRRCRHDQDPALLRQPAGRRRTPAIAIRAMAIRAMAIPVTATVIPAMETVIPVTAMVYCTACNIGRQYEPDGAAVKRRR